MITKIPSTLVLSGLLLSAHFAWTQAPTTNTNANQTYVNVSTPKTPEATAFETYGNFSVNQFTGATNISIPIYTLQSRYLQVPIALSYLPSGIRVNQEASWVGLGFDLNAGGRITVETRGSVDFADGGLASQSNLRTGMQQLFSRLGTSNENAVLTFATFCERLPNPACESGGCPMDNSQAIKDMTEYGVGEPDIFRANFAGNSIAFYFDKTTPNLDLKWIGEQSNFSVTKSLDSYGRIAGWAIVDNEGVTYYFNQIETTTNSIAPSPVIPGTVTSAWLLTRIEHPSGDYIQFSYNNFGYSVPAFTMAGSAVYNASANVASLSSETTQNVSLQSPYYLSRIETENVAVDFSLENRTDLYGPGSKRLSQITVTDKFSNIVKKKATFNYSYFQTSVNAASRSYLNSLVCNLPSPLVQSDYLASSNSRLRLESVTIGGSSNAQPPYSFSYNSTAIPDKYSLSQDHWGYYNAIDNSSSGYRFSHLIPLGGTYGVSPVFNSAPSFGNQLGYNNLGVSRDCDPAAMQAMMLTKITYPTGGSTEFFYEPHSSMTVNQVGVIGGGLRVKKINNYASESLSGSTEYTYANGKYMGSLGYYTATNTLSECSQGGIDGQMKLSTNGTANYSDVLVGYGQIVATQKDQSGASNGQLIQSFDISTFSSSYSNGVGFDTRPAHCNPSNGQPTVYQSPTPQDPSIAYLNAQVSGFAPTPPSKLFGKLIKEEYKDNSGNVIKSTTYNYVIANYTSNFYDVKGIENRVGGFSPGCNGNFINTGTADGDRPVMLFVTPAKSFRSLLDNTVEVTYGNGAAQTKTQFYTYNSYYQMHSKRSLNSDGSSTTETYQYPTDLAGSGSTLMYSMIGQHIYSPIISTTITKDAGTPLTSTTTNYFNPSQGVYVPQNVQTQTRSNAPETRYQYNAYDPYGQLREGQKPNDAKETYLWGYHNHFAVVKILGADYATASGLVSASVLDAPADDATLRQELNKLRTGLPNALVTTYTYDPVFGVTSQTDPAGHVMTYRYDGMGRLAYIADKDNNVVKAFCYNFAGQPENCTIPAVLVALSGNNSLNIAWNVTVTKTDGTFSNTYSLYNYQTNGVLDRIPMGTYNISITPVSSSASAQLTLNGNTYTGTSFSLTNVSISAATTITLTPYSAGPCSLDIATGFYSPTNGISNSGGTSSFYITFYSSSAMTAGRAYQVATVNGGCRPSSVRTINTTAAGRSWTITVYPDGRMFFQMAYGSAQLNAYTTVSTTTLSYPL